MTDHADLDRRIDSNAKAIEALHELIRDGFTSTLHAINEQNQLISELRQETQEHGAMIAQLTGSQAETNQQIQVLIEESRVQRNWLQAAQENIQTLFAEIQKLWQRLNAA